MIAKPAGTLEVSAKAASNFENFCLSRLRIFWPYAGNYLGIGAGEAEPLPVGLDKFRLKIGDAVNLLLRTICPGLRSGVSNIVACGIDRAFVA